MISRDAQRDIEQVSERNTTKKVLLTGELGLLKPLSAYLKMPGYPVAIVHFKFFQPLQINFLTKASLNNMFKTLDTKFFPTDEKISRGKEERNKDDIDLDSKREVEIRYEDKNGNEITKEQSDAQLLAASMTTENIKGIMI